MTGLPSDAPELLAQLALGARQDATTRLREIGARAIDVETQHRKRRAIRIRLFSTARLGRPLQGRRDLFWIPPRENAGLQIESIASPRDFGRPQSRCLTRRCSYARSPRGWLSHCFLTRQAPTPPYGNAAKTERVPLLKGTKPEAPWPQHSPNLLHACPFPQNTLRRWPPPYPPPLAGGG